MSSTYELWDGSPAQRCRAWCYCAAPEQCRELPPEEIAAERERRVVAGIEIRSETRADGSRFEWFEPIRLFIGHDEMGDGNE
jgi:hypothetical protein